VRIRTRTDANANLEFVPSTSPPESAALIFSSLDANDSYWKKDDGSLEAKNIKVGAEMEAAAPMTDAQHKEGRATKASPSP